MSKAFEEAVALQDRIKELEAKIMRLNGALSWIAAVNACDYEYVKVAREALDRESFKL